MCSMITSSSIKILIPENGEKWIGVIVINIGQKIWNFAKFERDTSWERTNAGLASARARGRIWGRPRVMSEKMISLARQLMSDNDNSAKDVANSLGVSRATLYRYIWVGRIGSCMSMTIFFRLKKLFVKHLVRYIYDRFKISDIFIYNS